ncbi:MAG: alpha/beta hydrolase [Geminicoccaceae bacterium]|nr:MAG: alpha/beta hydrolase [Geminicoccaceae bacterium]
MTDPAWLEAQGRRLAYRRRPGSGPEVVFLTGFRSDMEGSKALALEAHCEAKGQAFTRFDYSGHGLSSGRFVDGCIGEWCEDALAVIDQVTEGPLVLVGSSMGGWIMTLVARARPERLAGLVGIAAAPDFTEDLIWNVATPEQRRALEVDGVHYEPSAYSEEPTPITMKLVEDGRRHLVLRAALDISCPIHLIHGQRDPDVPWQTSLRLAAHVAADDVTIELIKDGEHRLSRDGDVARILAAVDRSCGVRP